MLAQAVRKPREGHVGLLKRLVRDLAGLRQVTVFRKQNARHAQLELLVDSDVQSKRSLSVMDIMRGSHVSDWDFNQTFGLDTRVECNSVTQTRAQHETRSGKGAQRHSAVLVGSRNDQAQPLHLGTPLTGHTSRRLDDEIADQK